MQPEKIGRTIGAPEEQFGVPQDPTAIYIDGDVVNPTENNLPVHKTDIIEKPAPKPQPQTWPNGPLPPNNNGGNDGGDPSEDPNKIPEGFDNPTEIDKIVSDAEIASIVKKDLVNEMPFVEQDAVVKDAEVTEEIGETAIDETIIKPDYSNGPEKAQSKAESDFNKKIIEITGKLRIELDNLNNLVEQKNK